MHISKREIERRQLVSRLQSRITEVVGEFVTDGPDSITFVELLACFHEAMGRAIKTLLREEWGET